MILVNSLEVILLLKSSATNLEKNQIFTSKFQLPFVFISF